MGTTNDLPAAGCTFSKTADGGQAVQLVLTAAIEPQTQQTVLIFLRLGGPAIQK